MISQSARGVTHLGESMRMLVQPGIRGFVAIPLIINILVFILAIWFMMDQFDALLAWLLPELPSWLQFVQTLLKILFTVALIIPIYFTFAIVGNIIASPFLGLLAEVVEKRLRGKAVSEDDDWVELLKMIPRTIKRELQKMGYYLPRFIGLFILTLIPVVNLIGTPLLLIFGAWMMAIQYIDYPADNQKVTFAEMLAEIRRNRFKSLSFGGLVVLLMMVPGLNFIMIPAAVIGGTRFWILEEMGPHNQSLQTR